MSAATGNKIRRIREHRNYTQDYMSEKLGISQNTYSKIETGHTKLDTERLKDIAKILEVPVESILNDELNVFNNNYGHVDKFYGYIDHLHDENKELTQQTIKALNDQISYLQKENERLLRTIETLSKAR
jgi:transcriptional regulator with XRE-family HTH domain